MVILVVVASLVHQLAGPRFWKLWDAMVLVACKFPLAKVQLVPCLMDRYAQYNATFDHHALCETIDHRNV